LNNIKFLLDSFYTEFSQPKYWEIDPSKIPAIFSDPLDIEIAGFFSAIIAWGKRENIVKAAKNLIQLMNYQPYKFVTGPKINGNLANLLFIVLFNQWIYFIS